MCLGTQPPSAESAGSSLTGLEREGVFRLWSPLNEAKSIFSVSEIVARARNSGRTGMCCGAGGNLCLRETQMSVARMFFIFICIYYLGGYLYHSVCVEVGDGSLLSSLFGF